MHTNINFPHLGIELENVGKSISVFGVDIAYYGIIIGAAILIGLVLAIREAKRTGQNPEYYYDVAIYGVLFAILGARIYYVLFSWDMYKDNLLSIFNLRQGGLAIYGGVIGAVAAVFVYSRKKQLNTFQLFDTAVLSLLNGQMLGRWGNFFNREAFGEYTNGLFAMQLPLDAVRSADVTEKMRENLIKIDGVRYIQVHPTFLYESLWCMVLLIILVLYRKKKRYEGELFLMYLFGYGLGRVWIEGLRTDQLLLPLIGIPVSQLLAGIIVIVTGYLLIRNRKKLERMELEEFRNRRRERERRQAGVKEDSAAGQAADPAEEESAGITDQKNRIRKTGEADPVDESDKTKSNERTMKSPKTEQAAGKKSGNRTERAGGAKRVKTAEKDRRAEKVRSTERVNRANKVKPTEKAGSAERARRAEEVRPAGKVSRADKVRPIEKVSRAEARGNSDKVRRIDKK